jgi:Tol biopolymer transport system component
VHPGSRFAVGRGAKSMAGLVAAGAALLAMAPTAGATYPGRDGKLSYGTYDSTYGFGGISSIPHSSKANCDDGESETNPDGTACGIGRIDFSADGKRIVAARQGLQGGDQGQLEVLGSDGKNVTILKPLTSDDEEPAFLSGGTRITFTGTAGGQKNLYEVATDGSGLTQLTQHGGEWAAPCANGTIAYVNSGALYVMRADGSHVRRLVKRSVSTPDCAPKSRSVIYDGSLPHNSGADFIVDMTGGKPKRIPGPAGMTPVFSPDGTRIAFTDLAEDPQQNEGQFLVIAKRTGRRLSSSEIGDGGSISAGPIAWQPHP